MKVRKISHHSIFWLPMELNIKYDDFIQEKWNYLIKIWCVEKSKALVLWPIRKKIHYLLQICQNKHQFLPLNILLQFWTQIIEWNQHSFKFPSGVFSYFRNGVLSYDANKKIHELFLVIQEKERKTQKRKSID